MPDKLSPTLYLKSKDSDLTYLLESFDFTKDIISLFTFYLNTFISTLISCDSFKEAADRYESMNDPSSYKLSDDGKQFIVGKAFTSSINKKLNQLGIKNPIIDDDFFTAFYFLVKVTSSPDVKSGSVFIHRSKLSRNQFTGGVEIIINYNSLISHSISVKELQLKSIENKKYIDNIFLTLYHECTHLEQQIKRILLDKKLQTKVLSAYEYSENLNIPPDKLSEIYQSYKEELIDDLNDRLATAVGSSALSLKLARESKPLKKVRHLEGEIKSTIPWELSPEEHTAEAFSAAYNIFNAYKEELKNALKNKADDISSYYKNPNEFFMAAKNREFISNKKEENNFDYINPYINGTKITHKFEKYVYKIFMGLIEKDTEIQDILKLLNTKQNEIHRISKNLAASDELAKELSGSPMYFNKNRFPRPRK